VTADCLALAAAAGKDQGDTLHRSYFSTSRPESYL